MMCSTRVLGWLLGCFLLSASLSAPLQVFAAEKSEDADLEQLRQRLSSGKEAEIVAALEEIAVSKNKAAVPAVNTLLARGGTVKVLIAACKTAGKLEDESSSGVLVAYVRHRESAVRLQAARALLKTKGPAAIQALRHGLRSSDAAVRGISATGLGELGAKQALPDLLVALERNVAEAAAAIGQLCGPQQCEQFAERTGKIPFDIMSTGFEQILFRSPDDLPDEEKIRIIGRLRELGTAQVGKYLADVADRWPKDWSPKVKHALDSAAKSILSGAR